MQSFLSLVCSLAFRELAMTVAASGPKPVLVTLSTSKWVAFYKKSLNCSTPIGPNALSLKCSSRIGLVLTESIKSFRDGGILLLSLVINMLLKSANQNSSLELFWISSAMYSQEVGSNELSLHKNLSKSCLSTLLRNFTSCFLLLKNFFFGLICSVFSSGSNSESLDPLSDAGLPNAYSETSFWANL